MARCPLDDYQVKAIDQVREAEPLVSEGSIAAINSLFLALLEMFQFDSRILNTDAAALKECIPSRLLMPSIVS